MHAEDATGMRWHYLVKRIQDFGVALSSTCSRLRKGLCMRLAECQLSLVAVSVILFVGSEDSWAGPPRRISIGSGSGYLSYPKAQATLKLQPGDTLYISPGVYSGLSLGNLSGTATRPITVRCDPQAVFTTATPQFNTFPNVAHVRFEDFRFESYKSTCMKITGRSHRLESM